MPRKSQHYEEADKGNENRGGYAPPRQFSSFSFAWRPTVILYKCSHTTTGSGNSHARICASTQINIKNMGKCIHNKHQAPVNKSKNTAIFYDGH